MKKLISLLLALAMILMVGAAFAADGDTGEGGTGEGGTEEGGETTTVSTPSITINPANANVVENIKIDYVAYQILEADIDTDPTVAANGSTTADGAVAYYVSTADRADALNATELFNVSRVGETNKWYVELKNSSTTADQLIAAFGAMDLTKFESKTFSKAANADNATSGNVDAGYYYITSTLGSKIALQTLTAVTINEKNEYTTDDKEIPETDENSEIGKVITYTLTVNVPVTANKQIVLTDTMAKGLTYKGVKTQTPIEGTVAYNSTPDADGATSFTITYTAEQIAALVKDKTATQTITITVDAMVNGEAVVETEIENKLDLNYGNVYDAVPDSETTKTYKATFDKEDNDGNQLPAAQFKLTHNANNTKDSTDGWINLVEVVAGKTYRLATADDTTTTDTIVTNGQTVQINGLDLDLEYYLVETKAPTGYNILTAPVHLEKDTDTTSFVHADIVNQKGTQLPSTGGIGTTIFYVVGGLLLVGAAIVLVARRKANN